MNELFDRRCRIQMGTVLIDGLRVSFKIEKTGDESPNSAEISVWNLAPTTRTILTAKGLPLPVVLSVGYGVTLSDIFNGDILPSGINTVRNGADWVTTLKLGDGSTAYRSDRVQLSLAKGATLKDAVAGIISTIRTDVSAALKMVNSGQVTDRTGRLTTFFNGFTASGKSMDELNKLLGGAGYSATIQDGKLEIVAKGGFALEQAPLLSAGSGLIGSPEPGKDGLTKIRSLLMPAIKPFRRISVQTIRSSKPELKFYLVSKVTHSGDTHGNDWFSDIEAKAL